MLRLLTPFLLLISTITYAQRVQLLDATTTEPVPFSKVIPTPGTPFLADIDGFFTIPSGSVSILFRSQGYFDTTYLVEDMGVQLFLRSISNDLDEVTIVPGVNPAERIMELAMANRKKNHPMADDAFTYTSYSKFVFTMDPEALTEIPDSTADSNLIDLRQFFNQQHLFLLESTTQKYFEPPYREKEIITAYKVSGFSDPAFSTFSNELQSFNFYENQFNLLGKSYINPLAFGGIRRYLFILEDQTIVDGDTTFTIRFQPRKDKNFEGMKGWLYINSNGYALEKVIAEPAVKSESANTKIIQEYAFIDGKRWFPVKLSTEAAFPALKLDSKLKNGYLVGKGSTYIENIVIGADLSKERFNAVTIRTEEDANEKDSSHWNSQRKFELTDKEERTYVVVDSISDVYKLDQKFSSLASLAEGKIPFGYFQLDLMRLFDYRDYEGYRFGLGLENSKKLMKRVTVGGYFGYGTRDKDWKYGGYAKWMMIPKQFIELKLSFQEDIAERGGYSFQGLEQGLALNAYARHLYIKNMEHQRKAEFSISGYLTPRIKLVAAANYQRIGLTDDYRYTNPDGIIFSGDRTFDLAETSLEAIWTIREKVMYLGTKRVSKGSNFPRIMAKATKGISGIEQSSLDYLRLNLDIQQDVNIRAVGKFSYLISAGKTIGDVPLFLNQSAPGTGGNWNLSVINSFETILPSTFYNKEQVAIFTRFTFKPLKTNKKWSTPQLGIHHAMGTGSFSRKDEHKVALNNMDFKSMDKGYYEVGLILDKVLNINTAGLGIGVFYNYGSYSVPQFDKNLTYKLSISFVIK